jgi:hypothetical protein
MATRATALRKVKFSTCVFQPHSLISSFALWRLVSEMCFLPEMCPRCARGVLRFVPKGRPRYASADYRVTTKEMKKTSLCAPIHHFARAHCRGVVQTNSINTDFYAFYFSRVDTEKTLISLMQW